MTRALLAFALVCACSPAPPAASVAASDYEGLPLVNPRLDDGRVVYRAYGDHHPECFAFVTDESRDTETVPCPDGAVHALEPCPAGRLHRGPEGCICAPIEGDASHVDCPR